MVQPDSQTISRYQKQLIQNIIMNFSLAKHINLKTSRFIFQARLSIKKLT
jgi:hypothetical protein